MTPVEQMKLFFEPNSVAILGASKKTGPGAFNIVECLQAYGYQGKILPINPNAQEILGIRCYPSIEKVRDKIELAVISLDRNQVLSSTEACLNAGIKAVIIISQGLADLGGEGKVLQDKIRDMARAKGARIVGPNTMGLFNNFHNFTTSSIPLVKFHPPFQPSARAAFSSPGSTPSRGRWGKPSTLETLAIRKPDCSFDLYGWRWGYGS